MLNIIKIDNYPYEVEITGSGLPTWVFFHGFMGSYADFEKINPKGTCIKINLFGFGKNAPTVENGEMFHMKHQVDSLYKLFKKLGLKDINLVGYSMGGRLALGFTINYPDIVKHLFLEGATAGINDDKQRKNRILADNKKADEVIKIGMEAFIENWENLPIFKSQKNLPLLQQKFMHNQRVNQKVNNVANSLKYMGAASQPNYWPVLANVTTKTTILVGQHDQKFQNIAHELATNLINAKIKVISDAGHNAHFENPIKFVEALNDVSD